MFFAYAVLTMLCYSIVTPVSAAFVPTVEEVFGVAGVRPLWGDPHAHSDFSDAKGIQASPEEVARAALRTQDFFILTDHGEQVALEEAQSLQRLTTKLQAEGLLFDTGTEWTGIPDEGDPGIFANPAYIQGGGHILIYRSSELIGHHLQGGEPEVIASEFFELLGVVAQRPWIIGGFAHPERYAVESTFGGFARPPLEVLVRQMALCELSSHGARGYYGPGDPAAGIRASNEAGFRQLIRVGWRPGACGSSDRHLMPYKAGPYTVAFVRHRSMDGVYEAFAARRTCFSEDRDMAIRLIGWLDQDTDAVALMGDTISLSGHSLLLHADVTGPVAVRQMVLVSVGQSPEQDRVIRSHSFGATERNFGHDFTVHTLRAQGVKAIYAQAELANGKQLRSSSIFIDQ
jgi:hypothetical protein